MYPSMQQRLRGSKSSNGVENERSRQIRLLLEVNKAMSEKSPDTYECGIRLQSGKVVVLQVNLPSHFPVASPEIRFVRDQVSHPWVDDEGRVVGCNSLYAWNSRTSDLGRLLHEVIHEFCVRPPQVVAPSSTPPPPSYSSAHRPQSSPIRTQRGGASAGSSHNSSSRDGGGIALPPVPDKFVELESLSIDDLQKLVDDEAAFEKHFMSMDQVITMTQLRDQLAKENVEIAKANLAHDEELQLLTAQVRSLQDGANESKAEFLQLAQEHKQLTGTKGTAELVDELKALAKEVDEKSEEMAFEFMNGDLSLSDFTKEHLSKRTLYHARQAKLELLKLQGA